MKTILGEMSDREVNYTRLQPLRGLMEKTLREEFHKSFDKDPGSLYTQLQAYKSEINKLLKKGIIGQEQYDLLLPPYGCFVYSEKFDVSLLVTLLRSFCGCNYTKNWSPKENDRSAKANIHRCLKVRHIIQHSPTAISEKEMEDIFDQVEQPLLELGATQMEFNAIKTMKIIDKEAKNTIKKLEESNKKFHYGSQTPVANFFSRDDELQSLHQKMEYSFDSTNNKMGVVISGMGGVGKSQLARQYWKIQGSFYDNCIWINGQSKETMENDFQTIGERCGLTKIKNPDGTFKELREILHCVYMYFARRKDYNSPVRKVGLIIFYYFIFYIPHGSF